MSSSFRVPATAGIMVNLVFFLLVRTVTLCFTSPSASGCAECILVVAVYFHDLQAAAARGDPGHVAPPNLDLRASEWFNIRDFPAQDLS